MLTERTDIFDDNGKTVSFGVIGAFELKDFKINAWREYFGTRALTPKS